jgi:hypothetical protein
LALSVTVVNTSIVGQHRLVVADVVPDDNYPLGGESLTAVSLGLQGILFAAPAVLRDPDTSDNALLVAFDPVDSASVKFIVIDAGAGTANVPFDEGTSTGDFSAYTARVFVYGW